MQWAFRWNGRRNRYFLRWTHTQVAGPTLPSCLPWVANAAAQAHSNFEPILTIGSLASLVARNPSKSLHVCSSKVDTDPTIA